MILELANFKGKCLSLMSKGILLLKKGNIYLTFNNIVYFLRNTPANLYNYSVQW